MGRVEPLAVSATVAAQMIGISRPTLYTLLRKDEIPSFQIGNRRLIPTSGLSDWVERQTQSGGNCKNV